MGKIKTIIKRDGREAKFEREKIAVAIWKSLKAKGKVGKKILEEKLDKRSKEWRKAMRLAKIVEQILIKSNPTKANAFRRAGGDKKWKVEEVQDVVEQVLLAAGYEEIAKAYMLYRDRQNYLRLKGNARQIMERMYLKRNADGEVIETPEEAIARVATCVADTELWKRKFIAQMRSLKFVPAGCYFRGAGNEKNGSLANCFVLSVGDSIEDIFETVKQAALIHQMGGGTGFNFSYLRPKGDLVGSGGLASGPINFMKAFDAETEIVMQGGTHRGANMGILNVDHPDIFEFMRAKSVDGEVRNFNISVGITDKFMRAVKKNGKWALRNPRDKKVVKKILAKELWKELVSLAHATGDPGMIFLDEINRNNLILKELGPIEATNVCGEQPLHPFDVCNLGSINLAKFVKKPFWSSENSKNSDVLRNIKWKELEETVKIAVRFLDNGVDVSTYPIPQIEEMAKKMRRIGLGVMGWADMLVQLGVKYDSKEGVELAEKVMGVIQKKAREASKKLAEEKGVFPLWKKSDWVKKHKMRNIAVTTIAPTGKISMIADCSSGIEPYYALEYNYRAISDRGLSYKNKYYESAKLKTQNLPAGRQASKLIREVFKTTHEIKPEWHIKMQAAFQKYTDNAVSKTINFRREATVKEIERAYMMAWELGCKGVTVYRDGSKTGQIIDSKKDERRNKKLLQSQIQVTPLSKRAYKLERRELVEEATKDSCPECGGKLEMAEGCNLCRNCGWSKCLI
jgi:ribonucleoside-diphosphate reductase alpha chain